MFDHPRSVELDKSFIGDDEQVPVHALLNSVDDGIGNQSLELIAGEAVKPSAGANQQCAAAGNLETGDLITETRAGMIKDRQGSVGLIESLAGDADQTRIGANPQIAVRPFGQRPDNALWR